MHGDEWTTYTHTENVKRKMLRMSVFSGYSKDFPKDERLPVDVLK